MDQKERKNRTADGGERTGRESGDYVVLDVEEGADPEATAEEALRAVEELEAARAAAAPAAAEEAESLRKELAELRDSSMRTLADFDNFRKRSERERQDLQKYALVEPMRELLAVVDNMERALAAEGSVEDLKQGVEMTLNQFMDVMRRRGVEEVAATGEPFDPAVHDAVSRYEDPEVEQPMVAQELQKGYTIHDRLLRPAMVKVAMPAVASSGSSEGDN